MAFQSHQSDFVRRHILPCLLFIEACKFSRRGDPLVALSEQRHSINLGWRSAGRPYRSNVFWSVAYWVVRVLNRAANAERSVLPELSVPCTMSDTTHRQPARRTAKEEPREPSNGNHTPITLLPDDQFSNVRTRGKVGSVKDGVGSKERSGRQYSCAT